MMNLSDPLFEQTYNPEILTRLERRYGPFEHQHADLHVTTEALQTMVHNLRVKKSRRGEVVMVVPNQQGQIWLHTKTFYPAGTYRLMTGGIEPGEPPHLALHREVKEETGFSVTIQRCLGVITYHFLGQVEPLPFVSYLFLTTPGAGQPDPTDSGEAIEDFRPVSPKDLVITAHQLRDLGGSYADWGKFRAVAHEVAGENLLK